MYNFNVIRAAILGIGLVAFFRRGRERVIAAPQSAKKLPQSCPAAYGLLKILPDT